MLSTPALGEPLVFQAALDAAESATVYAYQSGIVKELRIQIGDGVAAGDTLARMADETLRLDALKARLGLEKAKSRMERMRQLYEKGGVATQDLEGLGFEVRTADILWKRAQLDWSRATITAGVEGVVAELAIQVGERLASGQPLCRIIQPGALKAELFIPADRLHFAQGHRVVALAPDGARMEGRIDRISPLIDVASGTCRIIALFPNPPRPFQPGRIVRIELNGE